MLKIPKDQLNRRYDSLPDILKEALFDEESENFLWSAGERHGLDENKKSELARIVGDVIMGFVAINELGKNIASDLGLSLESSEKLASEINANILTGLKSDIESVYKSSNLSGEAGGAEQVVNLKNTLEKEDDQQAAPQFGEEKKNKIEEAQSSVSQDYQASGTNSPEEDMPPVVSEAEPVILHEEKEFKSISSKASGGLSGVFGFLKNKPAEERKPSRITAEVTLPGNQSALTPQGEQQPQSRSESGQDPKLRVVHYSDFRSPVGEKIQTNGQPPQIEDKGEEFTGPVKNVNFKADEIILNQENKEISQTVDLKSINVDQANASAPIGQVILGKEPEKTSQNTETGLSGNQNAQSGDAKPPINEIKLEDLPVKDDTVDLRNI